MRDLFGGTTVCEFQWIVGVFRPGGATEIIKRANDIPLKTYYPLRLTNDDKTEPLWSNYLFIEFLENISIQICKTTSRFIKILRHLDGDPITVPDEVINKHQQLLQTGYYDYKKDPKIKFKEGRQMLCSFPNNIWSGKIILSDNIYIDDKDDKLINATCNSKQIKVPVSYLSII